MKIRKSEMKAKQCDGKYRYPGKKPAQDAAKMLPDSGHPVSAYKCPFGDHWHVGHIPKATLPNRRARYKVKKTETSEMTTDKSLIVHIDGSKLPILQKEGSKLVFKREAEDAIMQLFYLQHKVEKAIDFVKGMIEKAGLSVSEDFKSVQGDKVKAGYRQYGAKYVLDGDFEELPEELYEGSIVAEFPLPPKGKPREDLMKKLTEMGATKGGPVCKLKPSADIDKWMEEHDHQLPVGLTEPDRKPKVSLKPIEDFEE